MPLNALVRQPRAEQAEAPVSDALAIETRIARAGNQRASHVQRLGTLSAVTARSAMAR